MEARMEVLKQGWKQARMEASMDADPPNSICIHNAIAIDWGKCMPLISADWLTTACKSPRAAQGPHTNAQGVRVATWMESVEITRDKCSEHT